MGWDADHTKPDGVQGTVVQPSLLCCMSSSSSPAVSTVSGCLRLVAEVPGSRPKQIRRQISEPPMSEKR